MCLCLGFFFRLLIPVYLFTSGVSVRIRGERIEGSLVGFVMEGGKRRKWLERDVRVCVRTRGCYLRTRY